MSSPTCEVVAERVALGEPLGDAADHAASCARCRRIVALPAELGVVHREIDPGAGFSSRMTAGAQHRVVVRRRRRIAVGLAAAVAASSFGVYAVTRDNTTPAEQNAAIVPPTHPLPPAAGGAHDPNDPWGDRDPADIAANDDLRELARWSDTKRAMKPSAQWRRIERSLAPYEALVEGVEP